MFTKHSLYHCWSQHLSRYQHIILSSLAAIYNNTFSLDLVCHTFNTSYSSCCIFFIQINFATCSRRWIAFPTSHEWHRSNRRRRRWWCWRKKLAFVGYCPSTKLSLPRYKWCIICLDETTHINLFRFRFQKSL